MDDRQIVSGVRLGDRQAVAELYDRYADVLHDYARRRAHSEADAADVVHDAFLVAVERIEQLRDPDRLRPWLYAIARTELHRRYRHAARFTELDTQDEWREPVSQEPGPDVQVERRELVALLREATAGLADGDRELLDLHLRHGLVGADLAAAAGIPVKHASVALDRVKGRLTRTLGVVLLARQPTCAEFVAIRDALPGLSPLARKRLARHVGKCDVCAREQSRRLRPEVLLAAVPVLPAPPDLRHRLVAATDHTAPADRAAPTTTGPRGYRWDADGFPLPRRGDRRHALLAAGAVVVLVLAIGGAFVARPWQQPTLAVGAAATSSQQPAPSGPTSGPALPGAVRTSTAPSSTTPTTTTPAPTTTTRRPTTTPPPPSTTTTTTPDTAPPVIGRPTLSPTPFSTSMTSGGPHCAGVPTRATLTVEVTDPSGVAAVAVSWSAPGASGSQTFPAGAGGRYSTSAGPVPGANLAYGNHTVSVSVVATDTLGNETRSGVRLPGAVQHCPPVIG